MGRGKDLVKRHRRSIPIETRFWPRVAKLDSGCWEWQGARNHTGGYGVTCRDGKNIMAHRASWELHRGPVPPGLFVLHHCDNPPCVNPDHLYVGTKSDNGKDAFNRGQITVLHQLWKRNKNKTYCAQGHLRTPKSTYVSPSGNRSCWICRTARNRVKNVVRSIQRALVRSAANA